MKNTVSQTLETKLSEIFNYLHEHPEVSWKEYRTTAYIKELTRGLNCRVTTFDDGPGLIAEVGTGKPVVALRADMDALWQEVNGEFQANHSCGHDAHMTIAIGTLIKLLENGLPEMGTFRFIFQPAEEKGTGALSLVEKGIVDDVEFLYGMHLRPIQELTNGYFSPGIQHGAAKFLHGKIIGEDAHGARPHLNTNAIQVGSEFFQHLNNICIDPMIPHSAKMTMFKAGGESHNIIPGNGTFSIDIRAQTNEAMDELTNKVEKIAEMLAEYHNVEIQLELENNVAAAVISDEAVEIMKEAIVETVGYEKLKPVVVTTGGDDFHFYAIKKPHLKATMLAIGCDLTPGLHHPKMTFNQEAIGKSVDILAKALINTASRYYR